jgi:hypothetical protein
MGNKNGEITIICPICKDKTRPYPSYKAFSAHWQMGHPEYEKPSRELMTEVMKHGDNGLNAFTPKKITDIIDSIMQSEHETASEFPPEISEEDQPDVIPPMEAATVQTQSPDAGGTMSQQGTNHTSQNAAPAGPQSPGLNFPRIDREALAVDPYVRLNTILYVHGVPDKKRESVMNICQLHPDHLNNPMNLHNLLASKLDKAFHSSIQLMVSEFMIYENPQEEQPPYMMPLAPGMQGTPNTSNQQAPYYPGSYGAYGQSPGTRGYPAPAIYYNQPAPNPEAAMDKTIATMTLMFKMMKEMTGGGGASEEAKELRESIKEMRQSMERIMEGHREESREIRERYEEQMREVREESRDQVNKFQTAMHETEKTFLNYQIQGLQQSRAEEMSEGLGSLMRDAGEGLATEISSLRENVKDGLDKVTNIAGNRISQMPAPGSPGQNTENESAQKPSSRRTPEEAARLMELESDIEDIATFLENRVVPAQGGIGSGEPPQV